MHRPFVVALACTLLASCNNAVAGDAELAANDAGACENRAPTRVYYRDEDGDGVGVASDGIHACSDEAPSGFSSLARDCDDDDANKQYERFIDEDGDDYGLAQTASCVDATEPGYADFSGDCDDADDSRSPAATETWFDGADLDCDGEEDPVGCIGAPGVDPESYVDSEVIALPPPEDIPVERDEDCDGADLYIAIAGACRQCGGGTSTVVIANRGTQAARFKLESNSELLEPDVSLPPQSVSEALVIELSSPDSPIHVAAQGDVTDCDLTNNTRHIEVGFTDCE